MFSTYAQRFVETYDARAALERLVDFDGPVPVDKADADAAALAAVALAARERGYDRGAAAYHLAAPVQRVSAYERLLRELRDATPANHDDAVDAQGAHDAVHAAIEHVDAVLRSDQSFKRLLEIHDRCDTKTRRGFSNLLDAPSRTLVKEGSLEELLGNKARPLAAFALSDRLLLATTLVSRAPILAATGQNTNNAPWKRKLIHHVPFEAIDAVEAAGNDRFTVSAFAGELALVLKADAPDQRDEWVALLNDLCDKLQSAPKPLRRATSAEKAANAATTPDRFQRRRDKKERSRSWAPSLATSPTTWDPLSKLSSLVSSATKRSRGASDASDKA